MLGELALGGLGLAPLIRWPGGKYRFSYRFRDRLPAHRVYVEPFFGGGSMFFAKPEAPLSILGDVTPRTIKFHVAVRNGALRKCANGVRASRAAIATGNKPGASACEMLAASFSSYHGSNSATLRDLGRVVGLSKLRHRSDYEGMLRRAFMTQGDFARTVKMGERKGGKDAFYFLDPPWPGVGGYSKMYEEIGGKDGADSILTPQKVRKVMDGVSGKAWIVYNDHPEVRKAFCGGSGKKWRCYRVQMQTADPRGGGSRLTPWLIATNYKIGRK